MELDELFPDDPEIVKTIERIRSAEKGHSGGASFDEAEAMRQEESVGLKQVNKQVPDGTYTVVIPGDSKPHRTIEVTPWKTRPGFKVFSMLTGPDNSLNFTGFGQQGPDGNFRIWKSFAGRIEWITAAQSLILIYNEGDIGAATEMYALKSKRCARCHHKLSVPASLHRGLGPDCAEEWGVA